MIQSIVICTFQEPRSVVLGTHRKWKGSGENRRYKTVEDKMIYIPLLETLRSLLENDTVMSEVRKLEFSQLFSKVSVMYIVYCVLVIVSGCLSPESINGLLHVGLHSSKFFQ